MMLEDFKSTILPLKNKLFRFANSILEDEDMSKDVVQETMIKAWEKRSEFNRIVNIEAWCMTLTRNFALDKLRSKHHKTMSLNVDYDQEYMDPSPYLQAELGNTMEVIDAIIGHLPLKQKETFHLRDVDGMSYQEIAEITGYNINDVKVNIFRARKKIKNSLLKIQTHGLEKSRSAS
jgi:RNA polymerase sigma factor (sigma-70 family)